MTDKKEPTPLHPASAMVDEGYDYFSTTQQDRLPVVTAQIKEREEKLFELELSELALDGNPATKQSISHDDFKALIDEARADSEGKGKKFVQQQTCPCIPCQLEMVRDSKTALIYSLNKLRALAATMSGTSKPKSK